MRTVDVNATLGQLVSSHPDLARELERIGLDFCCGGTRTLAAACTEAGLDLHVVATELGQIESDVETPTWAAMDAPALVDHLEATHHRYLTAEFPRLTELLERIDSVHGARHPELTQVRASFRELRNDLEPHLVKEERVLFPAIRQLSAAQTPLAFPFGSIRTPVSVMLHEHDRAGQLLATLRNLTHDYQAPTDGCASYRACYEGLSELEADTHLHIHKENNLLFPAVIALEARLEASHA